MVTSVNEWLKLDEDGSLITSLMWVASSVAGKEEDFRKFFVSWSWRACADKRKRRNIFDGNGSAVPFFRSFSEKGKPSDLIGLSDEFLTDEDFFKTMSFELMTSHNDDLALAYRDRVVALQGPVQEKTKFIWMMDASRTGTLSSATLDNLFSDLLSNDDDVIECLETAVGNEPSQFLWFFGHLKDKSKVVTNRGWASRKVAGNSEFASDVTIMEALMFSESLNVLEIVAKTLSDIGVDWQSHMKTSHVMENVSPEFRSLLEKMLLSAGREDVVCPKNRASL